jgi:hypothetical protein
MMQSIRTMVAGDELKSMNSGDGCGKGTGCCRGLKASWVDYLLQDDLYDTALLLRPLLGPGVAPTDESVMNSSDDCLGLGRDRETEGWRRRTTVARRTSRGIYRARGGLIVNKDVELTGVVSTTQKRGRGRRWPSPLMGGSRLSAIQQIGKWSGSRWSGYWAGSVGCGPLVDFPFFCFSSFSTSVFCFGF